MKIVCEGRVYNLEYGGYETVTRVEPVMRRDGMGTVISVTRELRRDGSSKLFYIHESDGGYYRPNVNIVPLTVDDAKAIAERFLEFNDYIKFFGDPEEGVAAAKRERDEALRKAKDAESSRDYWRGKADEKDDELGRLQKELEILRDAIDKQPPETAQEAVDRQPQVAPQEAATGFMEMEGI